MKSIPNSKDSWRHFSLYKGCKVFCTLDTSNAYLHMPMDHKSVLMQTIISTQKAVSGSKLIRHTDRPLFYHNNYWLSCDYCNCCGILCFKVLYRIIIDYCRYLKCYSTYRTIQPSLHISISRLTCYYYFFQGTEWQVSFINKWLKPIT